MKLGILVNTDRHIEEVLGLIVAAEARGHSVIVFAMDTGTKLLGDSRFSGLCKLRGVSLAFCDHSAGEEGIRTEALPDEIACGSQYDNASMVHASDKVIVL
jgi:hypothetical protein